MPVSRLRHAIAAATDVLSHAGISSARVDAELLAAHIAGRHRGLLTVTDDDALDSDFYDRYNQAIALRAKRIPLQYITGTVAFGPCHLHVGPGVFIPRPETEVMLDWVVAQHVRNDPIVIDVCTGSGALAVALRWYWPTARIIAVDDDCAALEYAYRNSESASIELVHADVTASGLLSELTGVVDVVVSNPPYIPIGVELEPEVAVHDPDHALFGGSDGMAVIGPIIDRAMGWLRPGGLLAVEHDDTTSAETVNLIRAAGCFTDIAAHRDLTGRLRFVTACRTDREVSV